MSDKWENILAGLMGLWLVFLISAVGAWGTHVVWTIRVLTSVEVTTSNLVLGALGTFIAPVGAVHGYMIWFGYAPF